MPQGVGIGVRSLVLGNEWVSTRAGGLNRYLAGLLDALGATGATSLALVVGDAPPGKAIGVSRLDASLPARLAAMRSAANRLAVSFDVVDVHFALYALAPLLTTRLGRLPLVVHFQGPWADESAVGRGDKRFVVMAKRAVERAVYRRASTVVVLSEAFGRVVVGRYGVEASRVRVIPPGVDLVRFHPGDRGAARAALGFGDVFVAVTARRLDARMGLDVLLDAWASVQRVRPGSVLYIAGEGRERDQLEAQRCRLPEPEGVRLVGRVTDDELVTLYQAADVSVVPTRSLEGFGLVTLESMACGTPPIVTDVGGLPDGVVGLDSSLVVPAEDPEALATRILAVANGNRPSRPDCRAHAETFSWTEVAQRHLELYRQAAGERRTRVAYLGHTAALSGGELALARMLPALSGVEAHVLLAEDGPLVGRLVVDGATVEVIPMAEEARSLRKDAVGARRLPVCSGLTAIGYSFRLARRLRRLQPDVVHTNTLKAALYGGFAGRLAGVPVVWHLRDRIAPDYLPRPAIALVRLAARVLPAAVIANSRTTLATLHRKSRSIVIPSAVDQDCVASSSRSCSSGHRVLTVGLVGRLAPWKGQDVFLRAFARAFPTGEARARIVGSAMFGEDQWAASLPGLADELGIARQVDFVGFVHDVAAEYASFDVLVHASTIPEPFGQVVVEGMASGLAVVAADSGGPAEVVTDGVDGLLYPMGDIEALAARLRCLADDSELRVRLGEAGRIRAGDFTVERVACLVEDVYRRVVEKRR